MPECDVLIIGSGIAGLSYALQVHARKPDAKITIVTKERLADSSSSLAQGGIAAVTDFTNDSFEQHIKDTLIAGDGLCDEGVVDLVVREAPARVAELALWGVRFDKNSSGALDLALEGGHSARRILHAADCTGSEIMRALIASVKNNPQITLAENHQAIELCCDQGTCAGAWVLDEVKERPYFLRASATMLAAGGLGQIFKHTTNPAVATGDGVVMAWKAGAAIADMEFIQFHPTALWEKKPTQPFLISEAVRGAGALLLNTRLERFMGRYDERLELATRDVVARAVKNEMRLTTSQYVYLDCRGIHEKKFRTHFPSIWQNLKHKGLDPQKDLIPVTPSAHYCCGGIVTDHFGSSTIKKLFAAGECARTGLHGANRLASNSLLEALVFARRAAERTAGILNSPKLPLVAPVNMRGTCYGTITREDIINIKEKMSSVALIIKEELLADALNELTDMKNKLSETECGPLSAEQITYGNLLDASLIVLQACRKRRINRGAFFREDEAALA